MRKRYGIAIAIILSITTTTSLFSFANNEADINQKLQNNKSKTQSLSTQLKNTKKKEVQVMEKIQALEEQINKYEEEIEVLHTRISSTEEEINESLNKLASAEKKIEGKQDIMGSRLNVMYRNGTIGYVEVLFSSKSFPEFLSNLDMVKRIFKHDVDLLKEMKEQRDTIEEEKINLENQKRQLVNLKSSVEQKQESLQVSRGEQERYRDQLAQDKVALEKELDKLEKEANDLVEQLRKIQSSGDYVGGELLWPVPGYQRISSAFGNRIHPILKTKKFHSGIDIPAPQGKDVLAANDGKVVTSGNLGGYGKTVIIDHGGGIMTLYAHNSKLLVNVGDTVKRGQKIALIGTTGVSTGPHLHFEVRKNGQYVDPVPYVK